MTSRKVDPNWGDQSYDSSGLPPGYRFCPTDEELVCYYLIRKVLNSNSEFPGIGIVDFNRCEPWDLKALAKTKDTVSYFFTLRDRKYPTGMRTNRATEAGYWKATGKDREVVSRSTEKLMGMKKTLVFYTGRAPKGQKTNWIMHEYRLEGESRPDQQEWVVCRVFEKSASSMKKTAPEESSNSAGFIEEYSNAQPISFLPDLQSVESSPSMHSVKPNHSFNGGRTSQISEPQGYSTSPQVVNYNGHVSDLRRSNSNLKLKKELPLGDTLENLVAGWDMSSPDFIWDTGAAP
ncbi:unnamed protein product [Calypogeia fissa]